jgi:hypothetical protein
MVWLFFFIFNLRCGCLTCNKVNKTLSKKKKRVETKQRKRVVVPQPHVFILISEQKVFEVKCKKCKKMCCPKLNIANEKKRKNRRASNGCERFPEA